MKIVEIRRENGGRTWICTQGKRRIEIDESLPHAPVPNKYFMYSPSNHQLGVFDGLLSAQAEAARLLGTE